MPFHSEYFSCNGQDIHTKIAGADNAPVMLMLHGFPEYWVAWAQVADRLATSFKVVLPDQRGFNKSSKPTDPDAYETKHLVADMVALIDHISPDQQIILCGHDWGASVAYALAMRHPDKVSHLVIANGVHPTCFQKSLLAGGAQTDASQYMNLLRSKGSEVHLSANNFEKLLRMFEKFSEAPWVDENVRNQYRAAWKQPGVLSAMLNWYRGSPMIVPESETQGQTLPITDEMLTKYKIVMPHLLLWGEKDTALLYEAREDLPRFCEALTVAENRNASHWILHEEPDWVADQIKQYLSM